MRYKLTDKFGVKRSDEKNWVAFEEVERTAKKDTKDGKKEGDKYQDDKVLAYAGDLQSAYRMLIKLIPNYVESKSELKSTVKALNLITTRHYEPKN